MPENADTRVVLQDVPKVGYHINGKYYFTPFAACLRSCLLYLGKDYAYPYILGMSGACFRLMWNTQQWDGGNVDIVFMAEDILEPYRRAFEAVGYTFEYLDAKASDEDTFRSRIIESIRDSRKPVLAAGVIGPPEICVVTGFDEGGDVLTGWNFFQDRTEDFPEAEFEPTGYFRKRNWFENTHSLFQIGDKLVAPDPSHLYQKALKWALKVMRTPVVNTAAGREYYSGLRAYEAWAEWMQRDEDFPDNLEILAQRKMVLYDAMCMVAERGDHASAFLREIASQTPDLAEHLYAAAECFEKEKSALGAIHEATGGFMAKREQLRNMLPRDVRKTIADAVHQARQWDAKATVHIELALA